MGKYRQSNQHNMVNYIQYRQRRPITSLVQLLSEDERFKKGQSIQDAYAEAWAFNFFLLKKTERIRRVFEDALQVDAAW